MEENGTRDISEKELVKRLESMPDNVVIRLVFEEEKAVLESGPLTAEWRGYGERK